MLPRVISADPPGQPGGLRQIGLLPTQKRPPWGGRENGLKLRSRQVWTGHCQQVMSKQSLGGLTLSREPTGVKWTPPTSHPQSAVKSDLSNLMFHLGKKTGFPRLGGGGGHRPR